MNELFLQVDRSSGIDNPAHACLAIIKKEAPRNFMSESSSPKFGINSWLEDELYQQYLHDQRA